jgi:hypothetical protein
VASSASLSVHGRPETLCRVPHLTPYFGREWLDILGIMVDKMIAFRDRRPSVELHDLHFRDLARDPIAAVRAMYEHFGDTLTPAAERAMRAHLAAHPRTQYGAHRYTLGDFGLRTEEVRERFARYRARFDVAEEGREA